MTYSDIQGDNVRELVEELRRTKEIFGIIIIIIM